MVDLQACRVDGAVVLDQGGMTWLHASSLTDDAAMQDIIPTRVVARFLQKEDDRGILEIQPLLYACGHLDRPLA